MGKLDYNKEMNEVLFSLSGTKPRLLLQSCCGPCSTAVIERLIEHFDITLYYYNPNTFPEAEYFKRYDTLKEYVERANLDVKIILADYHPEEFLNEVLGMEFCEGGPRCNRCIGLRLRATARYAKENRFDYFASTLSVSPLKNAEVINSIGLSLQDEYGVKYLINDFKKENGYVRSVAISKEFGLYRQNYCGCEASKNSREN